MKVPEIGTRAVHKQDYAKNLGPVWEVSGHSKHDQDDGKPPVVTDVRLKQADHKLNHGTPALPPKNVPLQEFNDDYRTL